MYIVDKIIEKAEKSTNDWWEGRKGNRNRNIDQKDYDLAGRSKLNEELLYLEDHKLAKVKWWSKPHEAEKITYNLDKLPAFYEIKRNEDPSFKTKQEKIEHYQKIIQYELELGFQQEWIRKHYNWLLEKLEKGEFAHDIAKLEEYIPVLRAIDQLKEPILKSEFSKQVLRDSKKFKRELEDHVITLVRKYSEDVMKNMSNQEILQYLMIEEDPQEMDIKKVLDAGSVSKLLFHPTEEEYEKLLQMYEAVEHPTGTAKAAGDALENLVKYLFGLCDAFQTGDARTATNQIDCCVKNEMYLKYGIFNTIGGHFFIECKNENKPPEGTVFLKLQSILANTNPFGTSEAIKFGIIISKMKAPETYKQLAQKAYASNRIVIITISGEELKQLFEKRGNLISLMAQKIFEVTGDIKSSSFTER